MRFESVYIEGVAHVVPDGSIPTAAIEKMLAPTYRRLGLRTGVLETMTGVGARGFWKEGTQPSDVATRAARKLLRQTGFDPSVLGAVVSTSVCKDYLEPSVAALVHCNLQLPPACLNFDIGNACLGFLSGLSMVAALIDAGQIEAGLVVAGEGSREVTMATTRRLRGDETVFADFAANLPTLTLGSAGVAMLLVNRRLATQGHRLEGSVAQAATEHSRLCIGTPDSMKTDAPRLLSEGVALAQRTWTLAKEHLEIDPAQVDFYALHQVGRANHDDVIARLGLIDDRAPRIYPQHGNVGAAGVPLTLSLFADTLKTGDTVVMMGIGSGLNVQTLKVRW